MGRELTLFLIVVVCLASNRSVAGYEIYVDLYTQYLLPWGGQGLNMVSDAFPPEAVIELRMNVTFQGDGVPGKPVSYMIKAPNGETYSAVAFTQADGIAVFEYSLPSSEDYFGQWTAKASVDIAGTMVSDTLYFLMGWLVEVVKIDAPAIAYKGETMGVTVMVARICMQDPRNIMNMLLKYPNGCPKTDNDLLLYITVTDELNQPVATSKLNMTMITELGVYDLDDFVKTMGEHWMDHVDVILTQYSELANVVINGVPISPWSFSGNAKIRANLITNCLGISYCPEGSKYAYLKSSISNIVTYRTDLNKDETVNIEDLLIVFKAYGSHGPDVPNLGDPPSENWNPIADVNKDNWVNIWDLCEVAKDYGKTV